MLLLQIRADCSRGLLHRSKLWVNNGRFGSKALRVALGFGTTIPKHPRAPSGRMAVGRRRTGAVRGSPGWFLVLAVTLHQSGVPLTARVQHCKHGVGSSAGCTAAPRPGPGGHPRVWGEGGKRWGTLGPRAWCGRRWSQDGVSPWGRAGAVRGSTLPAPCLGFPICGRR